MRIRAAQHVFCNGLEQRMHANACRVTAGESLHAAGKFSQLAGRLLLGAKNIPDPSMHCAIAGSEAMQTRSEGPRGVSGCKTADMQHGVSFTTDGDTLYSQHLAARK